MRDRIRPHLGIVPDLHARAVDDALSCRLGLDRHPEAHAARGLRGRVRQRPAHGMRSRVIHPAVARAAFDIADPGIQRVRDHHVSRCRVMVLVVHRVGDRAPRRNVRSADRIGRLRWVGRFLVHFIIYDEPGAVTRYGRHPAVR